MGVYGGYCGNMDIPEEKREVFEHQFKKFLNRGGMMEIENAELFGKRIALLCPVDENKKGSLHFFYNYFEDTCWESAVYNADSCYLGTGKIGSYEFNKVITAAYMLYDLYDPEAGYLFNDDHVRIPQYYAGWINYLLNEDFSIKKYRELWKMEEAYQNSRRYASDFTLKDLGELVPAEYELASGGTDYMDLYCIAAGLKKVFSSLTGEEIEECHYLSDIRQCWDASRIIFNEQDGEQFLLDLMKMGREEREQLAGEDGKSSAGRRNLAKLSLYMPARVLAYVYADIKGEQGEEEKEEKYWHSNSHFWEFWMKNKDGMYHDEIPKQYAGEKIRKFRENVWGEPCPKVRTTEFLRTTPYVSRCESERTKSLPNYMVSDDDRLFWWDGSDDVRVSGDTDQWLKDLAERHRKLVEEAGGYEEGSFIKNFITLLAGANAYYRNIMAFHGMFYEFIENGNKKEYQAAVRLFEKLVEENRETGKVIEEAGQSWELASRKLTFNEARLKLKRYLSVMANRKLREKYFGF